jgi:hypothetical protein
MLWCSSSSSCGQRARSELVPQRSLPTKHGSIHYRALGSAAQVELLEFEHSGAEESQQHPCTPAKSAVIHNKDARGKLTIAQEHEGASPFEVPVRGELPAKSSKAQFTSKTQCFYTKCASKDRQPAATTEHAMMRSVARTELSPLTCQRP